MAATIYCSNLPICEGTNQNDYLDNYDAFSNTSTSVLGWGGDDLIRGADNKDEIIGEVKNIGSDTLEFVKIGVSVYDNNGDIVGTDSTYAESSTLEPNQKSSFDIFSSKDNFVGMASYELSLSWQNSYGADKYVDNAQVYETE